MRVVQGSDLRVGDTIKVWWSPGQDTITGLRDYKGPLAHLDGFQGARVAGFALLSVGMTISAGDSFELVSRQGKPEGESMRHFGSDRGLA